MIKPLNEFGGWLRFFYLINIISIVIATILIILLIPIFIKVFQLSPIISLYFTASLIEIFLMLFLIFLMVKKVTVQDPSTPSQMAKYLLYLLILSTVFLAIKLLIVLQIDSPALQKDMAGFREYIGTLLSSCIWILYFRRSKRVNAFYGKNAGKYFFKEDA